MTFVNYQENEGIKGCLNYRSSFFN